MEGIIVLIAMIVLAYLKFYNEKILNFICGLMFLLFFGLSVFATVLALFFNNFGMPVYEIVLLVIFTPIIGLIAYEMLKNYNNPEILDK